MFASTPRPYSRRRANIAWALAVAADALQLAVFPAFSEGLLSPFEDALDVGLAIALTLLLGWNIAFLPTFLLELVPGADLIPTWTLAVLVATRGQKPPGSEATGDAP